MFLIRCVCELFAVFLVPFNFFLSFFLFYLSCVFPLYPALFFYIKTELIFNCPIFRRIIYQILLSYWQILFNFFLRLCLFFVCLFLLR